MSTGTPGRVDDRYGIKNRGATAEFRDAHFATFPQWPLPDSDQ
jgi:hypothetical protein